MFYIRFQNKYTIRISSVLQKCALELQLTIVKIQIHSTLILININKKTNAYKQNEFMLLFLVPNNQRNMANEIRLYIRDFSTNTKSTHTYIYPAVSSTAVRIMKINNAFVPTRENK